MSTRILVAGLGGAAVSVGGAGAGAGSSGPVLGWVVAATVFLLWTWSVIRPMDAAETAGHATRNDPARTISHLVILLASLASLAGVAFLLVRANSTGGWAQDLLAALSLCSVAASWLVVHTVFTLRYARLYYTEPAGGIDFNQDAPPRYLDFAYVAFSIGMTYQVSDTGLQTSQIRAVALRQALISFLLGAVILAITINLVAGLGTSAG